MRSHCPVLEKAYSDANFSTRLVMSNVAFSPSFMVMMASSHPIVYFLSAGDLKRIAAAYVGAIRPMLPVLESM
jgi:hypothetical protein